VEEINEDAGDLPKSDAREFQECLLTLYMFTIGGQRKEVILHMTTDVRNLFFFSWRLNIFLEILLQFPRSVLVSHPLD